MANPPSVLVVEDDLSVARSIARELKVRGVAFTIAHTVEGALQAPGPFTGAIVDINLPDGCGLSLAEQLKAVGKIDSPVFFSATTDPSEIIRAEEAGSFVAKASGAGVAIERLLGAIALTRPTDRPPRSGSRAQANPQTTESTSALITKTK